ncbi:DUF4037 domain-containing protein [Quadrisphaera granulorum]|uniref:DUF4037 domain-containing protein n=1 Tax=Quadrisphaera granulorum TaxID=317664 RepID=UPI001B87AE9F|nr:DUF4037 domain-containing protein [Quadrisphaera granulorum]
MHLTGADLAHAYWRHVVAPVVAQRWPGLRCAAARLGSGSDVLGLDDATSRDHDWGLRLTLLLGPAADGDGDDDGERLVAEVDAHLQAALPQGWNGLPVRFAVTWDRREHHRVEVASVRGFARSRLGLDPLAPWDALDWLSLTGQSVLEVVAGPVFTDSTRSLAEVRRRLAHYPPEVELAVVAAAWGRLSQELPLVGRTADAGDDDGSRIIAARLARVIVHLGYVLEQQWAPYPKWAGVLFARLPRAGSAVSGLRRSLAADGWREREAGLADALRVLHELQRQRGLPVPRDAVEPFWDRPYLGVPEDAAESLRAAITDPLLRALPPGVGAVEQWVDAVDVLVDPRRRRAVTDGWRGR